MVNRKASVPDRRCAEGTRPGPRCRPSLPYIRRPVSPWNAASATAAVASHTFRVSVLVKKPVIRLRPVGSWIRPYRPRLRATSAPTASHARNRPVEVRRGRGRATAAGGGGTAGTDSIARITRGGVPQTVTSLSPLLVVPLAGPDVDVQPVWRRGQRAGPPRIVRAGGVVGEVEVQDQAAVRADAEVGSLHRVQQVPARAVGLSPRRCVAEGQEHAAP